ncbi:hypothetical protein G6F46_015497 [Rhizopus delemar]|nr:hypothetical protein G6F46_015497 [Rhizopus delemar]
MASMCGPSTDTTVNTNTTFGMIWNSSVTRISSSSIQPPDQAAAAPMLTPITVAAAAATRPISRVARAPCAINAAMSRPMESVPSG